MAGQKQYEMEYKLSANLAGSFSSTFSKAQNALNETQEKLKALAQEQSDIAAYSKQQAAVEKSAQKLELLKKKLENVSQEYTETGSKSSTLANRMLDYENSIDKTSSALQKQEAELHEMESALTAAGVDTKNLGSESERLEREMDQLTDAEKEAQAGAEDFGEAGSTSVQSVAAALAAAGITATLKKIYDGFMDVVSVAGDFEAEMSYVEALSGGTGDEMAALTEKAKAMGAATKYTAQESASAFSYMALAGWDTESMLAGIEPVLNLAAAANMDLATASDIVTDYLTAFGLTADDTAGFVDQMAYAMSHSNTDVEQLGEAYKACAATSKSLGYSVEETTAILMAMANAGVKGGEAGTALNAIMTRLATDTKGCASALEEYGVHVYDAEGNMQSLSSILTGTAAVFGNLTDQEQANLAKMIAGTNQYSKFQTIMAGCGQEAIASGQSFSDYAAALEDCNGAATEMADTMLNNMNGKLTIMQSAWEGLTIAVGEQFTPVLSGVYEVGAELFALITDFVNKNPTLVKALGAGAAAIVVTSTALVGYAAAASIASKANEALAATTGLALGPVLEIAAAIGGAVAVGAGLLALIDHIAEANDASLQLENALEGVNEAQASIATSSNIIELTNRYQELREELNDSSLSSSELAEAQQELSDVRSQLSEATGGAVSAEGELNDALDAEVEVQQTLAEIEEARAKQQIYDDMKSAASDYAETLLELRQKQQELADAEKHMQDSTQALASGTEEALAGLSDSFDTLQDKVESGLIDPDTVDGAAELRSELDSLEDQVYALTGVEVSFDGLADAQSYIEDLDVSTGDVVDSASDAADEYARLSGEVADLESTTKQYEQTVLDLVYNGYLSAADGADILGISTDALGRKMTTYWNETHKAKLESEGLADSQASGADAANKQTKATERTWKEQLQLKYAAKMVADGTMDAASAAAAYGLEVDTLNDYIDEEDAKQSNLEAALQAVEQGYLDAETAAERYGVSVDDINVERLNESLQALYSAYYSAYDAAFESMTGQFDLWDEAGKVSSTSMSTLQSNLESQITYWQNYNANLSTISAAAQEHGIDISGIWDHLSDGSPEAVAAVQGIAEAINTNTQSGVDALQTYSDSYNELQETIGATADTIAQGNGDVKEAMAEFWTAASEGFNDSELTAKFQESGQNVIQGFIDGLGDGSDVNTQLQTQASSWIDTFNAALGVHSPSTITLESGQNTIQGFVNGVDGYASNASSAMEYAANSAITAFKSQMNVTTLYTAGQNAIQGAINGISSMIPSLIAKAASAGSQAAQAYKDAQDINSPSKVFEYYGRMDMLGAIQGIEKTQQKANDTFEAAGLANAAAYQSAISEESGLATLYADQQQAILADIPGVLAQARGAVTVQDAAPLPDAGGMTIYYSPTYNISGNQDSSSIREVLAAHDSAFRADLKDFIVETMDDHEVDMVRRSIR